MNRNKRSANRADISQKAVKLADKQELEAAYREADSDYDDSWETAASDGLAAETWQTWRDPASVASRK